MMKIVSTVTRIAKTYFTGKNIADVKALIIEGDMHLSDRIRDLDAKVIKRDVELMGRIRKLEYKLNEVTTRMDNHRL